MSKANGQQSKENDGAKPVPNPELRGWYGLGGFALFGILGIAFLSTFAPKENYWSIFVPAIIAWVDVAIGKLTEYPGERGNPTGPDNLAGNGIEKELTFVSRFVLQPETLKNIQDGKEKLTVYGKGFYTNLLRDRDYTIPYFIFEWDSNLNEFVRNYELPFTWHCRDHDKAKKESDKQKAN